MGSIITYNFTEDLIQRMGDFIEENFLCKGKDLSRVAVVFGGKRPSLFLKRELSKRIKGAFFPPMFFSIDEFVEYLVKKKLDFSRVPELEAYYIVYSLSKRIAPDILRGREGFARFLPWAREIISFIELLDIEDIEDISLENIKRSAAIGYDVPQSINDILKNIIALREAYHFALKERRYLSRGLMYLAGSRIVRDIEFSEFDIILFSNLFHMHKTEKNIIKDIYSRDKAILFFQGSEEEWPALKKVARDFSCEIKPVESPAPHYNLSIYSGFDIHSEVGLVREILKNIRDKDNTVIVLPDPDILIPLLSEITYLVKELNVSMGYPLNRSPVFVLFELIFRAQSTRKGKSYYTRDYLKLLMHPFIKNLRILQDASITRVLIHKLEEVLIGIEENPIAGSIFIKLSDIERLAEIYRFTCATLKNMGIEISPREIEEALKEIHEFLFYSWEGIKTFQDFSHTLETLLEVLVDKGPLSEYPINLKIIEKLFLLKEEFANATFRNETFPVEDMFKIFTQEIESQAVSFSGSPLKGLQILGLFETRSLSFKNVIILDVNESVLPKLRVYEPLIPRDVMLCLGINRLEEEEEIQRYQFMRLISSSENVFLIYNGSEGKERSRFIEELIWEREKKAGITGIVPVKKGIFQVGVLSRKPDIGKKKYELQFLKEFTFSSTSIDTYLNCPQMFYYRYILGLKEKDEFFEEPEGLHIGTFIHTLLEETFRKFEGKAPVIDEEFRRSFFDIFSFRFNEFFKKRMKGDVFLLREMMMYRLSRFLESEREREVKEVVCVESKIDSEIETGAGRFKLTSRIDRIDRLKDGSLFIIDYKTGGVELLPKGRKKIEKMEFTRASIRDTIRSFQLPLYIYLTGTVYKGEVIKSGLYYLRGPEIEVFPGNSDEVEYVMERCMDALEFILGEILDPEINFVPDIDPRRCENCPFFNMCG